jgi:DNA-binding beta-propeller fold protein YncE
MPPMLVLGVAVTAASAIAVVSPQLATAETFVGPTYSSAFGSPGKGNGELSAPEWDAIDAHGDVWVTDTRNNRVEEFSEAGTWIRSVGSEGKGNGQFIGPEGIAINASSGDVFVVDTGNNRVEEFSETGAFLSVFGSGLADPTGVAVASNGSVWVTNTGRDNVFEYAATGKFVKAFGSVGTGPDQFDIPEGIAIGREGDVYVSNGGQNERVQELSEAGAYIAGVKVPGSGKAIGIDPRSGDLFVDAHVNAQITVLSPALSLLGTFASKHKEEGIRGIAINSLGDLYIVNKPHDSIEEWLPEA